MYLYQGSLPRQQLDSLPGNVWQLGQLDFLPNPTKVIIMIHDHHGDGGHDGDDDIDDDEKNRKKMSILLKSRLIGFSGVFWFYSGASLVMALYAYLVKTT